MGPEFNNSDYSQKLIVPLTNKATHQQRWKTAPPSSTVVVPPLPTSLLTFAALSQPAWAATLHQRSTFTEASLSLKTKSTHQVLGPFSHTTAQTQSSPFSFSPPKTLFLFVTVPGYAGSNNLYEVCFWRSFELSQERLSVNRDGSPILVILSGFRHLKV